MQRTDPRFQQRYAQNLDMSWIYHDSAIEGSVYSEQELRLALDPEAVAPPESGMQPLFAEIRRHREAIDYIHDLAGCSRRAPGVVPKPAPQPAKKKAPITVDVIKRLFLILHPEEGDLKTVRYRKDVPQHRLYFHEYAPPDKINYKVRQVVDWINDPETKKARGPLRLASRAHYDLLRIFPFPTDSGRVARLLMNLLLLRSGFPPAIVHSTERQRYYEALKGSSAMMNQIVLEAIENNLGSVEKLLTQYEESR